MSPRLASIDEFDNLRAAVCGSCLGPSCVQPGPRGSCSLGEILGLASALVPLDQCDRKSMPAPQTIADGLLHAAAVALFVAHHACGHSWCDGLSGSFSVE